jgi:GAF domain-containing protein
MSEYEHIWITHFNRAERKSSRTSVRNEAGIVSKLAVLDRTSSERPSDVVQRILAAAREHLGMDLAFISEFARGEQVYRRLDGDAASFGVREGDSLVLDDTFCQRVLDGTLANVVPDATSGAPVKDLEITRAAGIGAYIGVPLWFSDGRLYGTLCCVSHLPDPSLRDRDKEFMKVLARLIVDQLERE